MGRVGDHARACDACPRSLSLPCSWRPWPRHRSRPPTSRPRTRLPHVCRDGRRGGPGRGRSSRHRPAVPHRQELPGPRTVGGQDLRQRGRRTRTSPRCCSMASTTPGSTSPWSRPSPIMHWLTDGYGTDSRITRIVDDREIFIVFMVNPDGGEYDLTGDPVPGLAQEPPAQQRHDRGRYRPQPQLRLPLGVLRRVLGAQVGADLSRARRPSRRPRRGRCATSWTAAWSAAASRSGWPSPSTRPASRSCGRTATQAPTSRRT